MTSLIPIVMGHRMVKWTKDNTLKKMLFEKRFGRIPFLPNLTIDRFPMRIKK